MNYLYHSIDMCMHMYLIQTVTYTISIYF